jgi:aspartate/methionine/tyrosine aminotransferase
VIHPARSQRERMDTAELREALEEALSRRSGTQRHVAETPRLRQGVEAAIAASRRCTVSGEDESYISPTPIFTPKAIDARERWRA